MYFVKKDLPDEMPELMINKEDLNEDGTIWIVKLLVSANMAKSNGEARRLINGGGVSIDGEKITDSDLNLMPEFKGDGIMKVGKRRVVKIVN